MLFCSCMITLKFCLLLISMRCKKNYTQYCVALDINGCVSPYQWHFSLSQDPVIAWQAQSPPVSLISSRIANILHSIVSAATVELWTFVRNCRDLRVRTRPDNREAGQRGRRTCASAASSCFVAQPIHSSETQLINKIENTFQRCCFILHNIQLIYRIVKYDWNIVENTVETITEVF